jgi:hypothetical protein
MQYQELLATYIEGMGKVASERRRINEAPKDAWGGGFAGGRRKTDP